MADPTMPQARLALDLDPKEFTDERFGLPTVQLTSASNAFAVAFERAKKG